MFMHQCHTITLDGTVTVETGGTVTFTAHELTVLPGFHAEEGSSLNIN